MFQGDDFGPKQDQPCSHSTPSPSPPVSFRKRGSRCSSRTRRWGGWLKPTIMRIVVVFPAPFGPKKPKISPAGIRRSKSRTAWKLPNFLFRQSMAIIRYADLQAFDLEAADDLNDVHLLVPVPLDQTNMRGIRWKLIEERVNGNPRPQVHLSPGMVVELAFLVNNPGLHICRDSHGPGEGSE